MKPCRARHQAHQIDLYDLAETAHLEFAAAIEHGALREHEHVEPTERRLERFNRTGIADIELRISKPRQIRTFLRRIFRRLSTRAANRDMRTLGAEGLCD